MEGLGLQFFDWAALAIVAFSAVMAFARGLIREVLSIVALIGSALAALYLAEPARPFVSQFTGLSDVLAILASGLFIFLITFIIITLLTGMIAKTAHQSTEIGSFDRAAGFAYGVLRGILVVGLFVVLALQTTGSPNVSPQASLPKEITEAKSYPFFEGVAKTLERLLPKARDKAKEFIEEQRAEGRIPLADAAAAGAEAAPASEPPAKN